MINDTKLDFYIKNNYNVLIKGGHGVGKTAMITEAFTRNNLKWMYFSTSTMDPWVDFIGVPKEMMDENGEVYLDLVRPKAFKDDQVEAIFFDEFNRSPKKVRNAVMELIQFKSINGRKFNNLKVIWAAINPDDEENENDQKYDVEAVDPAQLDRFQIIIEADDKPNYKFFSSKYGNETARVAIDWWNAIPKEFRKHVSPRRLDYIIDIYNNNGDVMDAIPKKISSVQLIEQLKNGSYAKRFNDLLSTQNYDELKESFNKSNFYNAVIPDVIKNVDVLKQVSHCIPAEMLSKMITTNDKFRKTIISDDDLITRHTDLIEDIVRLNKAPAKIIKELKVLITPTKTVNGVALPATEIDKQVAQVYFDKKFTGDALDNTYHRKQWAIKLHDFLAHCKASNTDISNILSYGIFEKAATIMFSIYTRTQNPSSYSYITDTIDLLFVNISNYKRVDGRPYSFKQMYSMATSQRFFTYFTSTNKSNDLQAYLQSKFYI